MSGFKKATKKKAKVRAAFFGPSGSGKTFSMLRTAKGMGGRVALIDSENESASKYADRFDFDTLNIGIKDPELPPVLWNKNIEAYVAAIKMAHGYDVLIIDSMSHAWQELLEEVERLGTTKFKGNKWSAWSEGTPKQKEFIEAILEFPGHVLASMRSKTTWDQQKDENTGKIKPVRLGLSPEQRAGIEYEFDLLIEMNVDHYATVLKDRSGKFQDQIIERPSEDFGQELAQWLEQGETQETIFAKASSMVKDAENTDELRAIKDDFRKRGGWWWTDEVKKIITDKVAEFKTPEVAQAAKEMPADLDIKALLNGKADLVERFFRVTKVIYKDATLYTMPQAVKNRIYNDPEAAITAADNWAEGLKLKSMPVDAPTAQPQPESVEA